MTEDKKKLTLIDLPFWMMEKTHRGNPRHYFIIRGYKVCPRCSGMLLTGIMCLLTFWTLLEYTLDFSLVFGISAGLTILCSLNWFFGQFKKVSDTSRFISGALLGIAIPLYLELLPASDEFRIGSFSLVLLSVIITITVVRRLKGGEANVLRN